MKFLINNLYMNCKMFYLKPVFKAGSKSSIVFVSSAVVSMAQKTSSIRKASLILFALFLSILMDVFDTKSKVKFKNEFWVQSFYHKLVHHTITSSIKHVRGSHGCSFSKRCMLQWTEQTSEVHRVCFLDPENQGQCL